MVGGASSLLTPLGSRESMSLFSGGGGGLLHKVATSPFLYTSSFHCLHEMWRKPPFAGDGCRGHADEEHSELACHCGRTEGVHSHGCSYRLVARYSDLHGQLNFYWYELCCDKQ